MVKYHKNWHYGPLNVLLRQVAPHLCLWDGGFDGAYWDFKSLIDINHGRCGDDLEQALMNAVSTSQWLSLDCIHQWWAGPLRTSLKTAQLQTVLENACHIAEGWPIEHEPFDNGQLYGRDIITPGDPGCDESDYAREMFHLYLHEFFFPKEAVNADFIYQLERRRSRCQQLLNVHRLAHAAFPDLVNNWMRPPRISPSYGIGEPSFGSSSSPTPWLNPTIPANKDRPRESPRFLWDLKKRKTIDTNNLSEVPGYTVLSHTWGRWRKIVNGKPSSVHVDGVPWPVPENTLYDVLELPAKLECLASQWPRTPCLWFDLFCIPQDGAGPEMMEIQKAEIARQAVIFDRATIGSIWLNEIETWSPLEDAILWLLLDYLGRHTDVMKRREGFDNPAFRWLARMKELSKGIPLERTSQLTSLIIPTEETKSVIRELEAISVSAGASAASPGRSTSDPKDFKLGWQYAMERLSQLEDTELAQRLKEALRKKLNNFQTDQRSNPGVLSLAGFFDPGDINRRGLLGGDPEVEELAQDCLQQPLYDVLDSTRVEQSFTGIGTILRLGPGMEIQKDWGNINYLTTVKPAGWLTSLWTLQETCLRPGMRLLNKDLKPLAMGTCGQEITFDTLCTLVRGLDGEIFKLQNVMVEERDHLVQILVKSPNFNMPPGVIELVASLVATGMHRFHDISPLDILELGSRRWCSHRRGPAVMSAVGVTDWFESLSLGEAEHEKDLVLGCYPYSFVQSVREKVGAEFFASKRDRIRFILASPMSNVMQCTGTMMPFYWGCSTTRWRPQDMQDHTSTKGWEVTKTGSVKIKEACILVSTSAERPVEAVKADVFLEPPVAKAIRPLRLRTQNLHELMNSVISGQGQIWSALKGVVLMSSPTQIEGILLLQMAFPNTMSKVGNFHIEDTQFTLPEQEIVNWEVN